MYNKEGIKMEQKKNKIIKVLLSVFVLILIVVGASYAYSNWEYIGDVNTIRSNYKHYIKHEVENKIIKKTEACIWYNNHEFCMVVNPNHRWFNSRWSGLHFLD